LSALALEVRPPQRPRLLLEIAIDGAERAVEVLAPHAQRQRQVWIHAHGGTAAETGREVVERLPRGVDRATELQVGLVRDDTLPGAVNGQQGEDGVPGECQ